MAVVLPAPLWPSRPSTVPGATSRSRSRRAQRSPKRLPRPCGVHAAAAGAAAGRRPQSYGVLLFVHSTTNLAVHCTTWQPSSRSRRAGPRSDRPGRGAGRPHDRGGAAKTQAKLAATRRAKHGRPKLARRPTEAAAAQIADARRSASTRRARSTASPRSSTRSTCGRAPSPARASRASVATRSPPVAIRIADAEGFDAVSMRRIAAELDAGTMTLYHYVRTKDELLALIIDARDGRGRRAPTTSCRRDWRAAMTRHRPPLTRRAAAPPVDARHRRRPADRAERGAPLRPVAAGGVVARRGLSTTKLDSSPPSTSTCSASACTSAATTPTGATTPGCPLHAGAVATGDYPTLQALTDELGLDELWGDAGALRRRPVRPQPRAPPLGLRIRSGSGAHRALARPDQLLGAPVVARISASRRRASATPD